MKAVSVNGRITEVTEDQSNSKMGDHLGSIPFVFFTGRNIRQFLLISQNYGRTELTWLKIVQDHVSKSGGKSV